DSNKPINILTGIDYWLDNLMCNVPELVMCFHVNGIVQIIASAYYMLSELFQLDELPDEDGGESLRAGGFEDSYSDEDREEEEGEDDDLTEDGEEIRSYSSCSRPQNDSKAVAVIRSGLKEVDGSIKKESDLPSADPNTPIPLKYEDGGANGASEKGISLLLERGMIPGSWQHRMKLQLFLKASKAYYVLSDAATNLLKYGRALRYIKLSLQCYDLAMDPEYQLFVSSRCYEAAHELLISEVLKDQSSNQLSQLLKRLGNIRNEMGVYYMNQAAAMQTEKQVKKSVSAAEQDLWRKSFSLFEKGMKDFETIRDSTNTALLLCNTGRLMRICAQAHCPVSADESRGEFSPDEALYYNKV
ncbi:hypothetical protein GOODEAATRI_014610, partial [Goodea atripinnis]